MPGFDFRVTLRQPAANGAGDDELRDGFRRVENPVALAAGQRWLAASAYLAANGFEIGDGLLEDMTEDVDVEVGLEIVFGQTSDAIEAGIGHVQAIQHGIGCEQSAVVGGDPLLRPALINRFEQAGQLLPARGGDKPFAFGRQRLMQNLGRQ